MRWVVVGAGSSGCVVAARLAERDGHHVTLVEAGDAVAPESLRRPSFFDALATPGWSYPGAFRRGRGVGGSGAINGMIATPLDAATADAWSWDDAATAQARVRVPMQVAADDELGPIDRAMLAAAPDTSTVPLTQRAGRRVTAFDAYLADGATPVEIVAGCAVNQIVVDGTRATGVRLADGRELPADAVVTCAGAIGSPLLLARSGVDVAGVGRHLRNHVGLPVTVQLRPSVEQDAHGLVSATLLRRDDLQILPMNHAGPGAPGRAGFLVAAMAPTGSGHVTTDGDVHLALTDHDHARLAAGVELVDELLRHPAFRAIVDDRASRQLGEPPAGVFHATSTCRIGTVVGDDGAVVGYDGLFVVDASIFPDLPDVNPYLPTLMLAERMAPRLLGAVAATRSS